MKNLGIYIHVPFCQKKCPYCDFYSVANFKKYQDSYIHTTQSELLNWSNKLTNRYVDSIYFGGGTPTLLDINKFCSIIDSLKKFYKLSNDIEITTEANPNIPFNFAKAKEMGLNRVSLGVQSFNEEELMLLGRNHTEHDISSIVKNIKDSAIDNISFDIMIGIQKQTLQSLKYSLDKAISFGIKHISAYMLKIEPHTVYYLKQDELNLPSEDSQAELYLFTCEYLQKNGFRQYEISNFAIPGYESKHNLKYWNCDECLGIGPAAYSFVNSSRFFCKANLQAYKFPVQYITEENPNDINSVEEYIMLQLRLNKGLTQTDFMSKFNMQIPAKYFDKAKKYIPLKLLTLDENHMALTPKGFLLSNIIISDLLS